MNYIKKYKNNQFITSDGVWIRDFTNEDAEVISISNLYEKKDYELIIENEFFNKNNSRINNFDLSFSFEKVVIVSNGFGFNESKEILLNLPKDVGIFCVNDTLNQWNIERPINYYIINNPYKEATSFLPKKNSYYPSCITSTRTNVEFCKKYAGVLYCYYPPLNENFGITPKDQEVYIDDYRNPICAALVIAYKLGAKKINLFCCQERYNDYKPGMVSVNGQYAFQQQLKAENIIKSNIFWINNQKNRDAKVSCFTKINYQENDAYINEMDLVNFFEENNEK